MFSCFFSFSSYFTENTHTVSIIKDGFSAPLTGVLPSSCDVRDAQILHESRSHIKILGTRRVMGGFRNITHHGTKFTRHINLAPRICSSILYYITCPMLNRFFGLSAYLVETTDASLFLRPHRPPQRTHTTRRAIVTTTTTP